MSTSTNNYSVPIDSHLVRGEPGKILSDLKALRDEVGNLEAKKRDGVMYKVKSFEELDVKLRLAADKLGMPMAGSPVAQSVTHYTPIEGVNRNGQPQITFVVHCISTVRFMSDDGSYVDFVGSGHGGGTDDKSGGKASTYASKDAILKGLRIPNDAIPDTDDEEGKLPAPPSLKMVLDAVKSSMTLDELEEAKTLAGMGKWNTDEEDKIKTEFLRRKAALVKSN